MRHSPTAYKTVRPSLRGFFRLRAYGEQSLVESSTNMASASAFGLKLVQRATFFQDPRIPHKVKQNLRTEVGEWVIYLPNHERTMLMVGDNPTQLVSMAAAAMGQITMGEAK